MRPNTLLMAGAVLAAGLAVVFFGYELRQHLGAIEAWIADLGWMGMLVFAALTVVALCLFMSETLFSVAAGVLFGVWWNVAVVFVANFVAGALQYGLAYHLLREPIRRKLGPSKVGGLIERVASSDNLRLQALVRLAPVHQTLVSYLLGASGVRFRQFLSALPAMLPAIFLEVYLGHTGKHLATISVGFRHASWQHDVLLVVGLLAVIVAVGFASRRAYRALLRATESGQ